MGIHDGHRQRMKRQFLEHGIDGFEDHAVLELLLYYAIPQGDVNPVAHRLLSHFGSLSAVFDFRQIFKKAVSLFHSHIKNVGYAFSFVFYLKSFPVISFSLADVAWNIYIRQKVHFYLDKAVAAACLTPAAFHIKAESSRAVSAGFCVLS